MGQMAHVKIRNRFTGFFATKETTVWHLEVEHCTHRGCYYKWEGNIEHLREALEEAIIEMEKHEYAERMKILRFCILS